jgi:hypothetical protein
MTGRVVSKRGDPLTTAGRCSLKLLWGHALVQISGTIKGT